MARVGPNQDINDPTTIIDLLYQYQQQSNSMGNRLAQSNTQNPGATGSSIINVSIPFKRTDGSTQLLYGSDISYDDGYIYDTDLVEDSIIVTYVNLAERFRDYWETLNNVLDQLNSFYILQETNMDPEGPTTINFGNYITRTHGSLGGTSYDLYSYSYSPSESLVVPNWSGEGPISYNRLTYPQLLSELQNLSIQLSTIQTEWDTIYWYDKFTDTGGSTRNASASFGKDEDYSTSPDEEYVQFYNYGSGTMEITLSISISATFDTRFSTAYSSWAEIDDINVYPDPDGGNKFLLSSYLSDSEEKLSPGGTTTFFHSRTVEIPPGKSAFIGGTAGAGTTFGPSGVGTVNITMILDDKILTHSASVLD
jgi:hypothetical protein